ncbi:hypothetical protein MF271_17710 (plasmid) [Deinococcus sp. KNUC1210]|uniref:hypothetical protein n=1 Tax=Deinococcus sp. KNUC1210 TaxID=2917691 RepID=UPI001EEF8A1C|nr:hypothetical protein [Deinococcus sp. KNUC1210]ULH17198.1 hypothetical protein MF271_17710 [Deinococcus sp. KNUC1210]
MHAHPSEARHVPHDPNRSRQTVPLPSIARPAVEPRQYAETWYQCLHEPQTHTVPVIALSGSGFGTYVRGCGQLANWRRPDRRTDACR